MLIVGGAVVCNTLMHNQLRIRATGESQRSISPHVLMDTGNLVTVGIEVRDILTPRAPRLTCKRRRWMRVSQYACGVDAFSELLPEALMVEDPAHLSRADVLPLRGLTHADVSESGSL